MWIVDDSYVLRVYQNLDRSRVAAEHRLLDAIDATHPPFAVPLALATRSGESFVDTTDGPAALYPLLPGRPGTTSDLELIGAALGDLMATLGRLPHNLAPIDWRVPLSETHPAVPDVAALVDELAGVAPGAPGLDEFASTWAELDAEYLALDLPVQICHLDFAPGNALIDDGRVSAVLDFEVAGLDYRVSDFVAGLVQSTDTPEEGESFTQAFRTRLDLTAEEWAVVPSLKRLRRVATVVWRAGRWRQGHDPLDEVLLRLAALQNPYI